MVGGPERVVDVAHVWVEEPRHVDAGENVRLAVVRGEKRVEVDLLSKLAQSYTARCIWRASLTGINHNQALQPSTNYKLIDSVDLALIGRQ